MTASKGRETVRCTRRPCVYPAPLAWVLVWGLLACGAEEDLPPVAGRHTALSLLTRGEAEVRQERESAPMSLALVTARDALSGGSATLPAILASPPFEVRYELPSDLPAGATIDLALGFDGQAYALTGSCSVRFEVSLDGKPVVESVREAGKESPKGSRDWQRLQLDISGGQELMLRTSLVGGQDREVPAAFGLLDVTVPVEWQRERSDIDHPNLVLIVIDTTRADRLGCYGYESGISPAIDALAERGALFERAYVPSPWTWPSTASILTGLTPPAHGVVNPESCFLAHEMTTLAEYLREHGFATAASSMNPLVSENSNFDQGFDEFHGLRWADAWEALNLVEPWLRARGEERFFLYLHLTEPHAPYEPRPDLASSWIPEETPEGWKRNAVAMILGEKLRGKQVDEDRLETLRIHGSRLYDGEIATVDHAIHDLLELLESAQLLENTIVALTSDHGEEFLEHGSYRHRVQLYEESLHVPLIIAGPKVAPQRIAEPVQVLDLGGTLLNLLNVPRGEFGEGPDLLDPVDRRGLQGAPLFFTTSTGRWVNDDGTSRLVQAPLHAVRMGDDLLLWRPEVANDPEGEAIRLFDVVQDPGATQDLVPTRPERAQALKELLKRWLYEQRMLQPNGIVGGEQTLEMLQAIGYVGD